MENINRYPFDLAELVEKGLKSIGIEVPTTETLAKIFECIYFASLKTEELQQICCSLTYIDSNNPDPKPPKRIVADRWSYVRFENQIELNIKNVVKLSKAANPYTTSIAIYNNETNLYIWGLIDQAHRYHNFINFESSEGSERPGLFQISITGIGSISVFKNYKLIAELRQGAIINKYHNVLWSGPVSKILQRYTNEYIKSVKKSIGKEVSYRRNHWDATLSADWINAIRRILLGIQRYKHGGALLIIPNNSFDDLNIKYKISYDRLSKLLHEVQIKTIHRCTYEDDIFNEYISKNKMDMSVKLYLDESVSRNGEKEADNGIAGCVRFISSLSCVDGLVLLDKKLEVKGFGVEIRSDIELKNVYIAGDSLATPELLKPVEGEHFGTRHRSMMRYCSKFDGSIGFVISQDGDIRVITKVDDKLIIWENVMIQLQFES